MLGILHVYLFLSCDYYLKTEYDKKSSYKDYFINHVY